MRHRRCPRFQVVEGIDAPAHPWRTNEMTPIDYPVLRRLLEDGAQLIEVLPIAEYTEMHLPGAVNIPLKTLDAAATAGLDRSQPTVVYCWDGL
jgi:rhodanese-related sulfurtransferase